MKQIRYYILFLLFASLTGLSITVKATGPDGTEHLTVSLHDSCYLSLTQAQKERALAFHAVSYTHLRAHETD